MPRTEILSPVFSSPGHNYNKMPELYSSRNRSTYSNNYSTSYDTSYGTSRKNTLLNNSSSSTYSSRPLPAGPGPLDATGRKLSNYSIGSSGSSTYKPRTSSHSITSKTSQPMKVEYGRTNDYSPSSYSSSRLRNTSDNVYRPSSGNLRTRRSSSLINLTADLTLEENKTPARRDSIISTASNSRTSSRSGVYDTSHDTDIGRSSRVSRACTVDRDEYIPRGSNRSISLLRESSFGSSSQRRQSIERDSPAKSLSRQSSNSSIIHVTGGSGPKHSSGGKVGLRNLGNTCFMNSVIQSLSNTKPLLEYCLNEDYVLDTNKTSSSMKGALMSAYANLMQSLWKNKHDTFIAPNMFKTQIQKFAPRFMGYLQQDAQEFLRYLLQGLHEDVNRVVGKPKPIILKDSDLERKSDAENAHEYWRAYIALDNSKIVEIFVGQLKSELKFTDCGHRSVTFDPFWDLSLPIAKARSEVSIQDCISLFMKEEVLGEDERPKCAKCKSRRSCTKSFSIQKFPKILVLHFKRFSQERYSRKVNTSVDYPVNNLDLTEFSAEKGGGTVLYNLYAVSCHSGSTHGGHYTAYCKHPYSGDWNSFNDTRVSGTRSNQAVTSDAYVLFYELVSHPSRL